MTDHPRRFLFVAEGDADTPDCWSGTAQRIVQQLRAHGHEVITADCSLTGIRRAVTAGLSYSPSRDRWWVRYHLGAAGFAARSAVARRHLRTHLSRIDAVVTVGGTFHPAEDHRIPYLLLSDGNIALAQRARGVGASDAGHLHSTEIPPICARETLVYQAAAGILTLSDVVRTSMIEDFGVAPERVRTVFAGANVDLARLPADLARPAGAPPTVLFIGRQFERKGGDLLLRVWPRVRELVADARLLMIGPRPTPGLPPGVAAMGLVDKSSPEGWATFCRAFLEASVYCTPSRYEGFSIAFLEAMAFARPCVALTFPWMRAEMIVDGETGFTVEGVDEAALVERLVRLLRDEALGRRLGLAGRERVLTHFTWPVVGERVARAVDDLLPA